MGTFISTSFKETAMLLWILATLVTDILHFGKGIIILYVQPYAVKLIVKSGHPVFTRTDVLVCFDRIIRMCIISLHD